MIPEAAVRRSHRGRGIALLPDDQHQLLNDWPIAVGRRSLTLGCVIQCEGSALFELAAKQVLGQHSAGWWECDLADNQLTWTSGIYQIFGFAPGSRVTRDEAAALYCEESRAAMERLRAHAIATGQGFALDARIRPASGDERWMRLIGSPVIEDGQVTRLQGLKLLI